MCCACAVEVTDSSTRRMFLCVSQRRDIASPLAGAPRPAAGHDNVERTCLQPSKALAAPSMASAGSASVVTVDAVREQLQLMGHQVPDTVITAFLQEAGFDQGARPQQTARETQQYQASFDFRPDKVSGSRRHYHPQMASRPHNNRPEAHAFRPAKDRRAVGNQEAKASRLDGVDTASLTDNTCSSCASECEVLSLLNRLPARVRCLATMSENAYVVNEILRAATLFRSSQEALSAMQIVEYGTNDGQAANGTAPPLHRHHLRQANASR